MSAAVAVVFIVDILTPQPKPDPNKETLAILCDLTDKVGHSAVCDKVPEISQQSGSASKTVQIYDMLYARIAASMFANFLATLGT